MKLMVVIYGKEHCPYTQAAKDHYSGRGVAFDYINVKADKDGMARMLEHSSGHRRVPVIVEENGKVTIGFGGT
jgi:glutaredoxin